MVHLACVSCSRVLLVALARAFCLCLLLRPLLCAACVCLLFLPPARAPCLCLSVGAFAFASDVTRSKMLAHAVCRSRRERRRTAAPANYPNTVSKCFKVAFERELGGVLEVLLIQTSIADDLQVVFFCLFQILAVQLAPFETPNDLQGIFYRYVKLHHFQDGFLLHFENPFTPKKWPTELHI